VKNKVVVVVVDEIVELCLEWCCVMVVIINYAMSVGDSMSLFMFGVLLLCVVEFGGFGEKELDDDFEMNWCFNPKLLLFWMHFMFIIKCISVGIEFGVIGFKIGDFGEKMV